jgi:hypothetical protein
VGTRVSAPRAMMSIRVIVVMSEPTTDRHDLHAVFNEWLRRADERRLPANERG